MTVPGITPEQEAALQAEANGQPPAGKKAKAGSAISFPEVEPWPDAVDGDALANKIFETVRRHVILTDAAATAVTLWVLLTWVCDSARVLPLLAIQSPEAECGKSTLLEFVGELARRPLPASNISASSVFRVIEQFMPTLLVDEGDTFLRGNEELRGVINSGHTRGTAYVLRTVGEGANLEVRRFSTWGAKAISLIGKLADTLERRSICVRLERKLPDERVTYFAAGDDEYAGLRRRIARWAEDHPDAAAGRPDLPGFLFNRRGDNWRPLLSIATVIGGEWPSAALKAARTLLKQPTQGEDVRGELLADIKKIFGDRDAMESSVLVQKLVAIEDRPWGEWGKQRKPMTVHGLAAQLRRFHISPQQVWLDGAKARGYHRDSFDAAWTRYVPPTGVPEWEPGSSGSIAGETADPGRYEDPAPLPLGNPDKPRGYGAPTELPTQHPWGGGAPPTASERGA